MVTKHQIKESVYEQKTKNKASPFGDNKACYEVVKRNRRNTRIKIRKKDTPIDA